MQLSILDAFVLARRGVVVLVMLPDGVTLRPGDTAFIRTDEGTAGAVTILGIESFPRCFSDDQKVGVLVGGLSAAPPRGAWLEVGAGDPHSSGSSPSPSTVRS